ncbi:MAG: hypothetical protein BWY14_01307 [Parcubacteria group bacterium ADurb.Bin192]|nr:MAG: hypothetical protein BWY14_01307 [Parcubacteria group bacterium ADurb.Bin192]
MARLQADNVLHAVASIAHADGVSIKEVIDRGADDLALRVAFLKISIPKQ